MGIRESLTLTWQDLDQSPLSLFTYCEEAMATKPNANSSTARLWNANTQATYHRMMEKMQALYFDSLGLTFGDLEFEHFAAAVDAFNNPKPNQKVAKFPMLQRINFAAF